MRVSILNQYFGFTKYYITITRTLLTIPKIRSDLYNKNNIFPNYSFKRTNFILNIIESTNGFNFQIIDSLMYSWGYASLGTTVKTIN